MYNQMIFVKESADGYYEEKKSKFIASIYPISNEKDALEIIEKTRKKYWDARHNCYAFVVGNNNELTRCSDDGEPSGTAGKPILEVIINKKIHNCIVIVTRYFGGTLLGTGGLVRAYQKAAVDSIENAKLGCMIKGNRINVTVDYNMAGKVQYFVQKNNYILRDIIYAGDVEIIIDAYASEAEKVVKEITDLTSGNCLIEEEKDVDVVIDC